MSTRLKEEEEKLKIFLKSRKNSKVCLLTKMQRYKRLNGVKLNDFTPEANRNF